MKKWKTVILSLIVAASILLTASIGAGVFLLSPYKQSHVPEELLKIGHTLGQTEFYRFEKEDRGGNLSLSVPIKDAYLDNGIRYRYVSFEEMPDDLVNAFIAIEDKRFYRHKGVDLIRTGRAAINYLFGSGDFGGSSITQQLVKNLTGHDEFSVERKLTEAFSALALERDYHKTEILEMYLNIINLSEGCRGVGAAAEYFYSKSPSRLSLSESASIAAITNNPSRYDPQKHPENNKARRNAVLLCMLEQGYISDKEYRAAIAEPIVLNISNQKPASVNSWYIDTVTEDVIADLCATYEISRLSASLMLYRGGLRIYTAMDGDVQRILDEYYSNEYNFPIDSSGNMPQSAMIVIDPYTGDILGVAGAAGQKRGNRLQNYATQAKRPPGSTIKPLSVYALAIERGIVNWASVIEDSPVITDQSGIGWPSNVNGTYVGNTDVCYAIAHSLNTVAVKVLDMVGREEALSFLRNKLLLKNLDEEKDTGAAALALGQPTYGLTLREMTAAYSVFQEGIMSKSRSYYLVTDSAGRIILNNAPSGEAVMSRETAAIMTKLMEEVVDSGTAAGKITLDSRIAVAGKSGTSQGNRDRYFIGYTPQLLAGVWFGYDYPKDLSVFGGNVSVYLWNEVMTKICEETDYGRITDFTIPDTVRKLSYPASPPVATENGSDLANGWFRVHISK